MLNLGFPCILEHPNCGVLDDIEIFQNHLRVAFDHFFDRQIQLGRPFETEPAPGSVDLVRKTPTQSIEGMHCPNHVQGISAIQAMSFCEQPMAHILWHSPDISRLLHQKSG
ncbi:Uncharacterised protein [Pseudomonas aeruginosa]|nr:Uncharacterised protein [Pseudomonas aeruginosa]